MQLEKDMRYWQLAERKKRITGVLVVLALGSFMLLAVLATWAPGLMAQPVLLGLNVGLLLALLVFGLCGMAAIIYGRIAEADFDVVAAQLQQDMWRGQGRH